MDKAIARKKRAEIWVSFDFGKYKSLPALVTFYNNCTTKKCIIHCKKSGTALNPTKEKLVYL